MLIRFSDRHFPFPLYPSRVGRSYLRPDYSLQTRFEVEPNGEQAHPTFSLMVNQFQYHYQEGDAKPLITKPKSLSADLRHRASL